MTTVAQMTKFVHIVQVHPVYDGILQTHKVKEEFEYETKEDAEAIVWHWNKTWTDAKAVYAGCVNDATGELV
jgi:hypothetical protein